jgi:transposase
MVHPLSIEDEDRRRITRERGRLLRERIEHTNRIKGLLMSQGVADYSPLGKERWARLEALKTRLSGIPCTAGRLNVSRPWPW